MNREGNLTLTKERGINYERSNDTDSNTAF